MEKMLNAGLIVFVLALVVRYFVSHVTGQSYMAISEFQIWEEWVYGLSLFWFLLSIWNLLIRNRCPKCRSTNVSCVNEKELDRWVAPKKVRERIGDGSYADRNVPTTFVKMEYTYDCADCSYVWKVTDKKEKT